MKLNYIGHSAFYIETNKTGILVDPFISGNPLAKITFPMENVEYIFLTHAHGDHLGDSVDIARKFNAKIFAVHELANYCNSKGANSIGTNLGGKIKFEWGTVKFLPAFHSSTTPEGLCGGCPSSLLFEIENKKIFHAGDTCLNSELKLIGELYQPDIAILPIGGHYTMDIQDATIAAQWLRASLIIPMHYNTFSLIKADENEFCRLIEKNGQVCKVMQTGENVEL